MTRTGAQKTLLLSIVAAAALALPQPAEAFRCKSRVVRDGMHEAEVIRLCGEPVSVQELGYVIRSFGFGERSLISLNRRHPRGYAHYQREVLVKEMLFNFGPRRLMRRVRFEGGIVTSIRTMGYGYLDTDKK